MPLLIPQMSEQLSALGSNRPLVRATVSWTKQSFDEQSDRLLRLSNRPRKLKALSCQIRQYNKAPFMLFRRNCSVPSRCLPTSDSVYHGSISYPRGSTTPEIICKPESGRFESSDTLHKTIHEYVFEFLVTSGKLRLKARTNATDGKCLMQSRISCIKC